MDILQYNMAWHRLTNLIHKYACYYSSYRHLVSMGGLKSGN